MPEQTGHALLICADVSRAKDILGYEPAIHLEDGIRRYVDWVRESWA